MQFDLSREVIIYFAPNHSLFDAAMHGGMTAYLQYSYRVSGL